MQAGQRALGKAQVQRGVEHGPLQLQRQGGWQIGQVRRHIELCNVQAGFTITCRRKGPGLRFGGKSAAIEFERQPWLHQYIAPRGQRTEEGNRKIQPAQGVRALLRAGMVGEVHRSVAQLHVVQGKTRQLRAGGGGLRGRGKTLQQVIHVVVPDGQTREVHAWLVDTQGVNHRCHPQQRLGAERHIHAADLELRAAAVGTGHADVRQLQGQRPGMPLHLPDRQCAAQRGAAAHLQLLLEKRRQPEYHCQPAQHQQGQHAGGGKPQTPVPDMGGMLWLGRGR